MILNVRLKIWQVSHNFPQALEPLDQRVPIIKPHIFPVLSGKDVPNFEQVEPDPEESPYNKWGNDQTDVDYDIKKKGLGFDEAFVILEVDLLGTDEVICYVGLHMELTFWMVL